MNDQTQAGVRADMIAEALALLHIIDAAADSDEDINDDRCSRQQRLLLRARAGRLAATIIAELQAPVARPLSAPLFAAAA